MPNWWYLITTVVSIALALVGLLAYPTETTPFTVFYGIILCLIFILPCGIVQAVSGLGVTLNVLAEFVGGLIAEGNALAMNYFKTFGCITMYNALYFANDLKLAHYVKVFGPQIWLSPKTTAHI